MTERSKDRIETPQLTLVRATIPLLTAEETYFEACHRWEERAENLPPKDWAQNELFQERQTSGRRFQELLGASFSGFDWGQIIAADLAQPWPQPLDDYDSRDLAMLYLRSSPESRWGMWYLVFKRPLNKFEKALLIGTCGFKGPPSKEGIVEIGYRIEERYQAVDLATEAVGALVAHAFEDPRVRHVMAETSAHHVPSIRVLGKSGFRRGGTGSGLGSLLFQRDREAAC